MEMSYDEAYAMIASGEIKDADNHLIAACFNARLKLYFRI
jgi:hypothetical protein